MNKNKWISVKDKLPDFFTDVLVSCIDKAGITYKIGDQYCAIDRYCKWNDGEPDSFRTDRFFGEVTHWMVLPKPPKLEECPTVS